MATQIYDNAYKSVQNIQIDGMLVTWSSDPTAGGTENFPLMMMGVQIQYGRQAIPYNTLNISTNGSELIQIMGRPTGIMTVQTALLGDPAGKDMSSFLEAASKTCGKGVSLTLKPTTEAANLSNPSDLCTIQGSTYTIQNAFLTAFNVSAQAGSGQISIADSLSFTFTTLQYTPSAVHRPMTTIA